MVEKTKQAARNGAAEAVDNVADTLSTVNAPAT